MGRPEKAAQLSVMLPGGSGSGGDGGVGGDEDNWVSKPFPIDTPVDNGVLTVEDDEHEYAICVSTDTGPSSCGLARTMVISLSPQYMLYNMTGLPLLLRQDTGGGGEIGSGGAAFRTHSSSTTILPTLRLPPAARVPYFWTKHYPAMNVRLAFVPQPPKG